MAAHEEQGLMTYLEYRAHCHTVHREPLPREAAGAVVTTPEYASPRPLTSLRPVFAALACGGSHITRSTLDRALPPLRLSLRHLDGLFEALGTEGIDLGRFERIFGGHTAPDTT